jgi:hypothetical protein
MLTEAFGAAERGFKSCSLDRCSATVVAIELLLKGFAGAGFEPATFGYEGDFAGESTQLSSIHANEISSSW